MNDGCTESGAYHPDAGRDQSHDLSLSLRQLEEKIGVEFRNRNILLQSFIRRSVLMTKGGQAELAHGRMALFGDKILGCVLMGMLFNDFRLASEGRLTRMLQRLVSAPIQASVSEKIGIGDFIRRNSQLIVGSVGSEEPSTRTLAECLEAIVAAVYLDQGLEVAVKFVERIFSPKIGEVFDRGGPDKPIQNVLQEFVQRNWKKTPRFEVLSVSGPKASPIVAVGVYIGNQLFGKGEGANKDVASEAAAREAVAKLGLEAFKRKR